jgi:hypothetical protein
MISQRESTTTELLDHREAGGELFDALSEHLDDVALNRRTIADPVADDSLGDDRALRDSGYIFPVTHGFRLVDNRWLDRFDPACMLEHLAGVD